MCKNIFNDLKTFSLKNKKVKDDANIENLTRSMRSCSVIEDMSDIDAENSESLPKRNEISRLEIIKHLQNDCFGYTEDFFIKGFHKLQEYKLKYFCDCQSRLIEMSTLFVNTITIDQCTQLKTPSETICCICQKEECESIIFKQDPIWLFIKADPFKRNAKIDS